MVLKHNAWDKVLLIALGFAIWMVSGLLVSLSPQPLASVDRRTGMVLHESPNIWFTVCVLAAAGFAFLGGRVIWETTFTVRADGIGLSATGFLYSRAIRWSQVHSYHLSPRLLPGEVEKRERGYNDRYFVYHRLILRDQTGAILLKEPAFMTSLAESYKFRDFMESWLIGKHQEFPGTEPPPDWSDDDRVWRNWDQFGFGQKARYILLLIFYPLIWFGLWLVALYLIWEDAVSKIEYLGSAILMILLVGPLWPGKIQSRFRGRRKGMRRLEK